MLDISKSAEDIAYYRSRIKDLQQEKMIILQREAPRGDFLLKEGSPTF
jgi:hypothetical protein